MYGRWTRWSHLSLNCLATQEDARWHHYAHNSAKSIANGNKCSKMGDQLMKKITSIKEMSNYMFVWQRNKFSAFLYQNSDKFHIEAFAS
jgi:hypothetical protein